MITDQAFILHKRAYKDSSELIKVMTRDHGVIDVIAKGSRRKNSKLNGQLKPFLLTEISYLDRSSLKTLIESTQNGTLVNQPFIKHVSMLYCNELLVLLNLDEDAVKTIFTAYVKTLKRLSDEKTVELALRKFEWTLCCASGYELTLPDDIKDIEFIAFDHQNGLVKDARAQQCQASSFALFIAEKSINQQQIKQVSRLMRAVINYMVNGREIKSRQLLR